RSTGGGFEDHVAQVVDDIAVAVVAAVEQVGPAAAVEAVLTCATLQHVVGRIAGQAILARAADGVLDDHAGGHGEAAAASVGAIAPAPEGVGQRRRPQVDRGGADARGDDGVDAAGIPQGREAV